MTFDRAALLVQIQTDEGFREYPYDDATGLAISPGTTIRGTVTFGFGFTWITQAEAMAILPGRIDGFAAQLQGALPWISGLSDARQRALIEMAYQLGVAGLVAFTTFLGLMEAANFTAAADDLVTTAWHKQSGARALRVEAQIREG